MGEIRRTLLACLLVVASTIPGLAAGAGDAPAPPPAADGELMHRIDFGNAYVMGQTIQSGAVYLLNRKQSEIHSMLETRADFRAEIREDAEVVDARHR